MNKNKKKYIKHWQKKLGKLNGINLTKIRLTLQIDSIQDKSHRSCDSTPTSPISSIIISFYM